MEKRKWPIKKNWNLVNLSSFHPQFSSKVSLNVTDPSQDITVSSILKIAGFHCHLIKNTDRNHPMDKKWSPESGSPLKIQGFLIIHMPELPCLPKRRGHVTGKRATVYGRKYTISCSFVRLSGLLRTSVLNLWPTWEKKRKSAMSRVSFKTSALVWQRSTSIASNWSRLLHPLFRNPFGKLPNCELSSRLNFNLYSRNQSVEIKR